MSFQANAQISTTGGRVTAALVAQAAAGDRDAFATLYNEHHGDVYRYLLHRTRDQYLAEDLTSETFVRALRRIDAFTERSATGGVAAWLCTIARNLYTDHCRASRTRLEAPVAEFFDADGRVGSAESDVLRLLEASEAAATVRAAMRSLTPAQQECIRLRFLEEVPLSEVAQRLGRKVGAVKTLTDRAKTGMRASVRRTLAKGVAA